jgi:translation initiation factor IF-2
VNAFEIIEGGATAVATHWSRPFSTPTRRTLLSQRIRVYQLAKQLGFAPKDFESTIRALGIEIKNYMSTLDREQADRVRAHVASSSQRPAAPISRKPTRPQVRRSKEVEPPSTQPKADEEEKKNSESTETQTRAAGESRLIRDERGVIVGTRRKSEPNIVGFIPVSTTRRVAQRVETVTAKEDSRGRASRRKEREQKRRDAARRRARVGRKPRSRGRHVPNTAAPRRPENRTIRIDGAIRAGDLAHQMGVKSSMVLRELWGLGLKRVTVNHALDTETAALVAGKFDYQVEDVGFHEDEYVNLTREGGDPRAPVVTVLGHVDHGKTTLLDTIRKTEVAKHEAGGITQHLGAYRVHTDAGDVVFLDTPGHAAFSRIRQRGASATDVALLVVAADDGVMPTTVESIEAAHRAEVPVVVAINKIDKGDANPGRVKQQLMEYGLIGEEFGGETVICEVSAATGAGIENLLESLALQAGILELCAPASGAAQAVVLDARIDRGRGPVASLLVQAGSLERGDIVVVGEIRGRVRGMTDSRGKRLDVAGPSTVVKMHGLDDVPKAGGILVSVDDDHVAKEVIDHRERRRRKSVKRDDNVVSIREFLERRSVPKVNLILKAEHQGSLEAIRSAVEDLSTEEVRVDVVSTGVGPVSENDAKLARASQASVLAFNVKVGPRAETLLDAERLDAERFNVIYDLIDHVRNRMESLLEPVRREERVGVAEVRALFRVPRVGMVAGCRVSEGLIERDSLIRVVRDGETIFEGHLASLKVHRDDVGEVSSGGECGMALSGWDDLQEGDRIAAFNVTEVARSLGAS